jgi:hypothetical protein
MPLFHLVSVHSLSIDRVRSDPEHNDRDEPLPDERVRSGAPKMVPTVGPEVAKGVRYPHDYRKK